ncbi:hypothetical protein NIES2100_64720 [Calothrix sp. NIES-2100]|uniref:hypothetical protein n=1 Tax=Calothrix sp. NIES-2100 TaxID=1954172 RepID=UPI000B613D2D|nr:hypothetical protein NIES2100_64720 [Calothrix sp. NIES-2100]
MLNNLYKFCSSHQVAIPAVALIITLGVFGEQVKSVLSHPITVDSQNVSGNYLLSQLREVKAQRNQDWKASATSNNTENLPQPNSQGSAKDLKTPTETTALVTRTQKSAAEVTNVPISNLPTEDGVYLYGQSPKPNQLGQGYIIFEKRQATVKGAMYMPNSEFSCFQGTMDRSGELAMTVKATSDDTSTNQVATTNTIPSINDDEFSSYAYSVALQDYHQLKSVSANDKRMLQMCNQAFTN